MDLQRRYSCGFFLAYIKAFSAVVLGYHRAFKKQLKKGLGENSHKVFITRECLLLMASMNWLNYYVITCIAKIISQIISDLCESLRSEHRSIRTQRSISIYSQRVTIRTNQPCFSYFATRVYQCITTRMNEIDFLAQCFPDFDDHI